MYRHDTLVSRYIRRICAHSHTHTHKTRGRTHPLSRESACEFRDTGEEKCKFSSLQVGDMASMGRWNMCMWEKEWDNERERFRERDGADSLCIRCIFPIPDALLCERTCLSGSENRWQSREDVASPTSLSLFTYVSHFSSPLSLFSGIMCPFPGRPRRRNAGYAAYFPFFSTPQPLPSSSLLSPMLLFLHSQVASRVRAGFVGAHARWRDTVTDLIAERETQTEREREGDKG